MAQSPQDTSGGSEQALSQQDVDAALTEAGLNPAAPANPGAGSTAKAAAGPAATAAAPTGVAAPADAGPQSPSPAAGTPSAAEAATPSATEAVAAPAPEATSAAGKERAAAQGPVEGAAAVQMPDFAGGNGKGKTLELDKLQMLEDVQLQVRIELGRTRMLVQDVLRLDQGSVVELDKLAGDPVDVYVNERLVARGEVLVLNDNFCVRVNEIVSTPQETVA